MINVALLHLSGEDVAYIVELTLMISWPIILVPLAAMILGTSTAAFSIGFADRQSFLAALGAAAQKTGLGLHAPAEDRLLLMTKAPNWLWNLLGRRHIAVTLEELANQGEAVITGPSLPVRRIQKEFSSAVTLPSPGSLGFQWPGLLFFLTIWATFMGLLALVLALTA
jgi:hypothetical protein